MKIKALPILLISLFICGCSSFKTSEDQLPIGPTSILPPSGPTSSYEPHEDVDPFPESPTFDIDTSSFTLDSIPVNFSVINDFHGQIDADLDNGRVGLAKTATYLLDRRSKGDVILSSGDNYQGSFLCNYDHGQLLSHAFKYIGIQAHTLGNHEFDWGENSILDNEKALGDKFLGANICEYPKSNNGWVKSYLGNEYKIINLYEGTPYEVKIGVIGVIGKNQITSISYKNAENFIFLEPTNIVKDISRKLRTTLNCDYVIASYHANDPNTSIADVDAETGRPYVDACFMAHSHEYENYEVNNVPFIQASAFSRGVSSISFTFNKNTGESTLVDHKYVYLSNLSLEDNLVVKTIIEDKKSEHTSLYNDVIGTNSTTDELDNGEMSQFFAKLSYDEGRKERSDLNIVGAMFNDARTSLKHGDFTYSDLFETHPFLNRIYVFSVAEKDIFNEKKYTYGYIDPDISISSFGDRYYDIIVYDYNGFHIGVNSSYEKYYNFFPSAFQIGATHEPIELSFNVVDLSVSYLQEHPVITNSDISGAGFYYKNT